MSQALVYKEEQASTPQQVWLVLEDSGEQWEDWDWPIGAFTSELAAKRFLTAKESDYKEYFDAAVAKGKLMVEEEKAYYATEHTEEQEDAFEVALYEKYTDTKDEWETRHFFKVQGPYPLNPSV